MAPSVSSLVKIMSPKAKLIYIFFLMVSLLSSAAPVDYKRADPSRWPNLWVKAGSLFYLNQSGIPRPLVMQNDHILFSPGYYPFIEKQVLAYYAAIKADTSNPARWNALKAKLPPRILANIARITPDAPSNASEGTEPRTASSSGVKPGVHQGGAGGDETPRRPGAQPEGAGARRPTAEAAPKAGTFPYFNPLPYPKKYKECEAKYLTGKCVDGDHYALMGKIDHTFCSSQTMTVFGHTPCLARAKLDFESCIAGEEVTADPKCESLGTDQEPNIRKSQVRNCRQKLIDESCRDGVPLDTMQCEANLKDILGKPIPPLRATYDDSCVSATRMAFMLCVASGKVAAASNKPLTCTRVGKEAPPLSLATTTADVVKANKEKVFVQRPKHSFGREYVDFASRTNLTMRDYQVFESCLVGLFGRGNIISYPEGNASFVVITDFNSLPTAPLQFVYDNARARPECGYLKSKLTGWDATYKVHELGPWGVAHEDDNVVNSDF